MIKFYGSPTNCYPWNLFCSSKLHMDEPMSNMPPILAPVIPNVTQVLTKAIFWSTATGFRNISPLIRCPSPTIWGWEATYIPLPLIIIIKIRFTKCSVIYQIFLYILFHLLLMTILWDIYCCSPLFYRWWNCNSEKFNNLMINDGAEIQI